MTTERRHSSHVMKETFYFSAIYVENGKTFHNYSCES